MLYNLRHKFPLYYPTSHLLWNRSFFEISALSSRHRDVDRACLARNDFDGFHAVFRKVNLAGVARIDLDCGYCPADLDFEGRGGCYTERGDSGIDDDGRLFAFD